MELLQFIGLFIFSLAVLVKSSDIFVDSAEAIGLSFGISPFIIGVTIIAFGTSLPELASSVAAVIAGQSEIVLGNVVGSNITNICIVLGLVAIVSPKFKLDSRVMEADMPMLLASAIFMTFAAYDGHIAFWEAIILLIALVVFLVNSLNPEESLTESQDDHPAANLRTYLFIILSGVFVWLSATYVVVAIEYLSRAAGLSPDIIAITAVAIGTSLPEIVVSLAAARKGKADIAVGNVIGSNIFNSYAVLAIPTFFGSVAVPQNILDFSLPFMVAVTFLLMFMAVSQRITKGSGFLFILLYLYFMSTMVERSLEMMN